MSCDGERKPTRASSLSMLNGNMHLSTTTSIYHSYSTTIKRVLG